MSVLSVCMIVRNEEKNLPRALASVQGMADELVVVDTGSRDRTVEIAQAAGARVFHFPWVDDFSAARNAALDRATGKWIFWLDADEELLPESRRPLEQALEDNRALAFYVLRQDLEDSRNLNRYTEMWQLRLFRNLPELRFQGRCHPHFVPSEKEIAAARGLKIYLSRITIRHYGYLDEFKPAKLKRAARLLELELRERPRQLYYMIEYGRTLLQLKDPRGAKVLAQAAKELLDHCGEASPPTPMAAALLEYLLQLPNGDLPAGIDVKTLEGLSERWFPRAVPLLWVRAQRAFAAGNYAKAEKLLRRLTRLGKKKDYDRHISFDSRILGDDAWLNLGVCLVRQAKLEEARSIFRRLLKSGRKKEAKANLKAIRHLQQRYGG